MVNQFVWGFQSELARSVTLHYPESIAQAMSLAETTELVVKSSKRLLVEVISQGAQVSQIGAEDDGKISPVVVGDTVVEIEVDLGIEEGVLAGEDVVPMRLIHWLATGVGFMVIWPVTVPALVVN